MSNAPDSTCLVISPVSSALAACARTAGLFERAILQSGSPLSSWAVHNATVNHTRFALSVAARVGCGGGAGGPRDVLRCLKRVPVRAFSDNHWKVRSVRKYCIWFGLVQQDSSFIKHHARDPKVPVETTFLNSLNAASVSGSHFSLAGSRRRTSTSSRGWTASCCRCRRRWRCAATPTAASASYSASCRTSGRAAWAGSSRTSTSPNRVSVLREAGFTLCAPRAAFV